MARGGVTASRGAGWSDEKSHVCDVFDWLRWASPTLHLRYVRRPIAAPHLRRRCKARGPWQTFSQSERDAETVVHLIQYWIQGDKDPLGPHNRLQI